MEKTFEIQTGAYKTTEVDSAKAASTIRVIAVDGTYTVASKVALSGKGIVARAAAGMYEVTKAAMRKLEKEYTVAADF